MLSAGPRLCRSRKGHLSVLAILSLLSKYDTAMSVQIGRIAHDTQIIDSVQQSHGDI